MRGKSFKIMQVGVSAIAFALTLSSCMDKTSTGISTAQSTTSTTFAGAVAATNLTASQIQITWALGSGTISKYRISEIVNGSATQVAVVPPNVSSYAVSGLSAGTFHIYQVNALDGNGLPDPNTVNVAAITYAGITTANPSGTTTATVTFPSASQASSLNIYCAPVSTGVYTLISSVAPTSTFATLTGLNSGVTYKCKVNAVTPFGNEDSNTYTQNLQTVSLTSTAYNGVMSVQAYGNAPNAPAGTPAARQVTIAWPQFTGATTSTQYALVRTAQGATLDSSKTTPCTSVLMTSCRVCTQTGLGAKSCTDSAVAAPPTVYDYTIVEMPNGVAEEMPASGDTAYRVTVPMPPDNMVLVHRDSANYEMCAQMSRVSDSHNHQRCAYTGLGATTYNTNPGNTPLGLTPGYYDFGYNLFVDRWAAGCNWTPGACTNGSGATSGSAGNNCFRSTDPNVGPVVVAPDKTVFYNSTTTGCWINVGGTWTAAASTSAAYTSVAYTNSPNPTYHVPPWTYMTQTQAWNICRSVSDQYYGPKRPIRKREWVVAAAPPWLPGEPGSLNDTQISTVENGSGGATSHTTGYYCNGDQMAGITRQAFNTSSYEGSTDVASNLKSFIIGSVATSSCVSRHGMQDFSGNTGTHYTDSYITAGGGTFFTPTTDTGNTDLTGFVFNGVQGPAAGQSTNNPGTIAGISTGSSQFYGITYFNVPLGMPLMNSDGGNALTNATMQSKYHSEYWFFTTYVGSPSYTTLMTGGGDYGPIQNATNCPGAACTGPMGRWGFYLYGPTYGAGSAPPSVGVRCVLPAQ